MTTNDVTSVTTGDILSREEVERIAFVAYVVQPYAAQMLAHDAALRSRLAAAEARAERLAKAMREIDARTGHFGEAPPPPEWMPMLSLIAWVGRISRDAIGEEGPHV